MNLLLYVKNDTNLLLDLAQMAAILDYFNAMSKAYSDNTTVLGIPENPMIDTKTLIYLYYHDYVENFIHLQQSRPFWIPTQLIY